MKRINTLFILPVLLSISISNATTFEVQVKADEFDPAYLQVIVGDTIRWIHTTDAGAHTTTSIDIPGGAMDWNQDINEINTWFEYHVTEPGTYNYHCTLHIGMVASFEAGTAPNAISQYAALDLALLIAPNPVSNALCIDFTTVGSDEKTDISITDVHGKMMLEKTFTLNPGSECMEVIDFPSGIYIVRVRNEGFFASGKFVVE